MFTGEIKIEIEDRDKRVLIKRVGQAVNAIRIALKTLGIDPHIVVYSPVDEDEMERELTKRR